MKALFVVSVLFIMSIKTNAQRVELVQFGRLQQLLTQPSDTTYIINFWATWCKPCVVELPVFEQINQQYAGQKVRVLLVSMDFAKDMVTRVLPFVARWQIANPVWLLNEPDYDSWINKVSQRWSGAIPATLILNNKKRKRIFFEQPLEFNQLEKELRDFL
ncbi:MAG: TlpA family protein disulfide reductase [Runella slithyformis]|nr:MAG: TlpA family protein disulfide reductase [Runella slithyformis]TAF27587.1 MAG: TlpA family protein disulfide reductase [Runella slithyformis]TAF49769.1 MAG: TlpA family protein disulfide reductase [Runella slithyformis]TAH07373.1 MAG: TlpA family protein disulfide reductase [Runella slithyformis]